MHIINASVVSEGTLFPDMGVRIDDKTILDIFPMREFKKQQNDKILDIRGNVLSAGFIDIHTHGCAMCDAMDATEESFDKMADFHFRNGETTFYPTTLTAPLSSIEKVLDCFRNYKAKVPVWLPGIHLEGPFLSSANKGAQNFEYLLLPGKENIDFVARNSDIIKLITVAPDLPGIKALIETCVDHGITVSGGHDGAIETEVRDAMSAGMKSVTHIFCSSSTICKRNFERHVGITEVALCSDALYAEAIADGAHLPYELFLLLYKCKGYKKIILVSDSIRATGMGKGQYYLGEPGKGTLVEVTDKVAMLLDKSMYAGSITPIRKMVESLAKNTDIPLEKILYMATTSPAMLMGLRKIGDVKTGYEAKLNVLSSNGVLLKTIANETIYER